MTLYHKNDPETIREMFDSIAKNYDRTNAVLSFQMHKRWNQTLIREVILPTNPSTYLDLCCGTGAIAFEYLKKTSSDPKVYMLDFSGEMLAYARAKAESEGIDHFDITYFQADAQSIPLPDDYIDCTTIAYGIRNVKHPELCFKEVYRVTKPGGVFGILELTQPANPVLRFGHGIYLRTFLPIMGKLLTSNKDAYRYLCNSIHTFIPPEKLQELFQFAGFNEIKTLSLMGGIATILIGKK